MIAILALALALLGEPAHATGLLECGRYRVKGWLRDAAGGATATLVVHGDSRSQTAVTLEIPAQAQEKTRLMDGLFVEAEIDLISVSKGGASGKGRWRNGKVFVPGPDGAPQVERLKSARCSVKR